MSEEIKIFIQEKGGMKLYLVGRYGGGFSYYWEDKKGGRTKPYVNEVDAQADMNAELRKTKCQE